MECLCLKRLPSATLTVHLSFWFLQLSAQILEFIPSLSKTLWAKKHSALKFESQVTCIYSCPLLFYCVNLASGWKWFFVFPPDEPKPSGPVELDENVPGTVTISWTPSPDEKRDDRLHYLVTKRDSVKRSWHTIGDRIFNNRFTACNIMPGREYQFRVYAKNDMGCSKPSESTKWLIPAKKGIQTSCHFHVFTKHLTVCECVEKQLFI